MPHEVERVLSRKRIWRLVNRKRVKSFAILYTRVDGKEEALDRFEREMKVGVEETDID
jgi:hypothetical protein